ncbi:hypothetical protein [Candidatus Aquicultor secundus]|nr:hypothetical protein [Candidatus Aquicultor secundus]
MIKRLLFTVALIGSCFVSVPYAAANDSTMWNTSQPVELKSFDTSSQQTQAIKKLTNITLTGTYITAPGRCRGCHEFKNGVGYKTINIGKTDDGSCDWCHADGAGSAYFVVMDNDELNGSENGSGHSRGYGIASGKWRAPDDTYPAFAAKYWRGGMSCLDCHPAHPYPGQGFSHKAKGTPFYQAINSEFDNDILTKNPDQERNVETGVQIYDGYKGNFSRAIPYPVQGTIINWDDLENSDSPTAAETGTTYGNVNMVNRTCIDCHDGDAGLHNNNSLVFSEERALSGDYGIKSYVTAHSHDSQVDKTTGKAIFNPEDKHNNGPDCRKCHSGGSDCDMCHGSSGMSLTKKPSSGIINNLDVEKNSVSSDINCSPDCISLGISWPHRTLAWKMLKDELFGVDIDGKPIDVGQVRDHLVTQLSLASQPAQDLDSVCLDCHNPRIWNHRAKEAFLHGLP